MRVFVLGWRPRSVTLPAHLAHLASVMSHRWETGAVIGRSLGVRSIPRDRLEMLIDLGVARRLEVARGHGTLTLYRLRRRAIRRGSFPE